MIGINEIASSGNAVFHTRRDDRLSQDIIYCTFIVLVIITVNLLIMHLSGYTLTGRNIYNSYALQAKSWLEGRLDTGTDYSHLEIAKYNGKYYVSFPPFPSVILLPFVLVSGVNTPDHILTLAAAAVSGIYAYKLACAEIGNRNKALLLSLFLCTGSNFLFLSNRGYVWFMAQVFAFCFTLISLYYACAGRRKPMLSLFMFCCALGCRPLNAVYLPLLFYLLSDKNVNLTGNVKKILVSSIPAILLGCVYMLLNYMRFGSIFEFGHNYLPEFADAGHGQFSLAYLPENIKTLWRLPYIQDGRLHFHAFNGTAFWLVSPVIIIFAVTLICAVIRCERIEPPLLLIFTTVSLHILLLCTHKTMGGWHFGHRYTADALPAVFTGLLLSLRYLRRKTKNKITAATIPLFIWGMAVNIYGTVSLYNGTL